MIHLFLFIPLLIGYLFTRFLVPIIANSVWYRRLGDRTLNYISLLGCGLLYFGIWGQLYASFSQSLFLTVYCPGCALLAFSLIRAHDKGAMGGIVLNTAFTILTFLPFIF